MTIHAKKGSAILDIGSLWVKKAGRVHAITEAWVRKASTLYKVYDANVVPPPTEPALTPGYWGLITTDPSASKAFSVTENFGSAPYTYNWYYSGTGTVAVISGQGTNLATFRADSSAQGTIYCEVTDSGTTEKTAVATVYLWLDGDEPI